MAFALTLDEALRAGAIVRGMDIDEDDVQEGEAIAATFRRDAIASGDAKLVEIIRELSEETLGAPEKDRQQLAQDFRPAISAHIGIGGESSLERLDAANKPYAP